MLCTSRTEAIDAFDGLASDRESSPPLSTTLVPMATRAMGATRRRLSSGRRAAWLSMAPISCTLSIAPIIAFAVSTSPPARFTPASPMAPRAMRATAVPRRSRGYTAPKASPSIEPESTSLSPTRATVDADGHARESTSGGRRTVHPGRVGPCGPATPRSRRRRQIRTVAGERGAVRGSSGPARGARPLPRTPLRASVWSPYRVLGWARARTGPGIARRRSAHRKVLRRPPRSMPSKRFSRRPSAPSGSSTGSSLPSSSVQRWGRTPWTLAGHTFSRAVVAFSGTR